MGARVLDQLDLDTGQRKKAEAIIAEERAKAVAKASGDPVALRQAMRATMQTVLTRIEPILKPAQKDRLVALRARMASLGGGRRQGGMTAGVVYVLRDGKPVAVPVRVGATDGSVTQIVGPLKAGDEVIVGGGPKAKVQARGGPMGGGVRVRM